MMIRIRDSGRGRLGATCVAGRAGAWRLAGIGAAATVALTAGPALASKTVRAVPAEVSAAVVLPPADLAFLFPGAVPGTAGATARGLQPDYGGPKAADHLGPGPGAPEAGARTVVTTRWLTW